MKIAIFIALGGLLTLLVSAFWWVKGRPLDWVSFYPRGEVGPGVMTNPGNPLEKERGS